MPRRKIPPRIRILVAERAKGFCEYCYSQEQFATHEFSIDHIIPLQKGGTDAFDNLALCCQGCNNYKHITIELPDQETGEPTRLFHPRIDHWLDHFEWNANFTVIKGISPIGRVTVLRLRLNRASMINQRVMYRAYGVHPPEIID
jgi:hypothetical protein